MKLVPLVIGAAILAGTCRGAPRADGGPDAAPPASGTSAPPLEVRSPSQEGIVVIVSKTQILVGDSPSPVVLLDEPRERGIDARYKRGGASDLFIVPLAEVLAEERAAEVKRLGAWQKNPTPEAVLVAHWSTPYRIFAEVIYTLGQAELGRQHLMVVRGKGDPPASAPAKDAPVPSVPRALGDPGKPLALRVFIDRNGFSLSASGGALGPGCGALGGGVTLPKRGAEYDLTGLAACARGIKRALPEHAEERDVRIGATAEIMYGVVIEAIDALRGEGDATMFSEPSFTPP